MKSSTETLIKALEVLAQEIQSPDGVANAAIAEAAERIEQLHKAAKPVVDSYWQWYHINEPDMTHEHDAKVHELMVALGYALQGEQSQDHFVGVNDMVQEQSK